MSPLLEMFDRLEAICIRAERRTTIRALTCSHWPLANAAGSEACAGLAYAPITKQLNASPRPQPSHVSATLITGAIPVSLLNTFPIVFCSSFFFTAISFCTLLRRRQILPTTCSRLYMRHDPKETDLRILLNPPIRCVLLRPIGPVVQLRSTFTGRQPY